MSTTEIPAKDPAPPSPPAQRPEGSDFYEPHRWESAYRDFDADSVPHLLIQLQDDLSRSRRREAAWLSIIVHLGLILLVINEPRLEKFFFRPGLTVVSPKRVIQGKELTYLELPPDQQKVTKRPDSNIISDKDRIATSRRPQLDPKELKKILDSARPGTPGISAQPVPQQPAQQPAVAQNAGQTQQQPPSPNPANQNQMAKLQAPPVASKPPNPFGGSKSVQSTIQQAEHAALENRGAGYGGDGGDYGLGQGQRANQVLGPFEVLSDTMGVDFSPYLQRLLQNVKENWYRSIPESAMDKKGKVTIEFAILKDGSVAGMDRVLSSGDIALDRAAWASITRSNPCPPLPANFSGPYLGLRFTYYYNLSDSEMR
jgi:TonB family protein